MSNQVVITGGSKGLGEEISLQLTVEGYDVTDISRTAGFDLRTSKITNLNCDTLILNAGVWDNDWRINFESAIELAEQMPKDRLVIFILSNAAYKSYGNHAYTAAKGGLLDYVRYKFEKGYNFATISPGTIRTGFTGEENEARGAIEPYIIARKVLQVIDDFDDGALNLENLIVPRRKV